eukprot:3781811-Amphidinium_carterae.1
MACLGVGIVDLVINFYRMQTISRSTPCENWSWQALGMGQGLNRSSGVINYACHVFWQLCDSILPTLSGKIRPSGESQRSRASDYTVTSVQVGWANHKKKITDTSIKEPRANIDVAMTKTVYMSWMVCLPLVILFLAH